MDADSCNSTCGWYLLTTLNTLINVTMSKYDKLCHMVTTSPCETVPLCQTISLYNQVSMSLCYVNLSLVTIYVKTEHFTLGLRVKDNDSTKTANIKIVLQSWHIFTRTRTIAMFYLKCKIVRTCVFCDKNPLKGFKIYSR